MVEIAVAFLFVAFYLHAPNISLFIRDVLFLSFLTIIFVQDLRDMVILDRVTIPAMIVALFSNVVLGVPAVSLLLGALVVGGFFAAQFLISKGEWIGGGDIRLGIVMGLMLGFRDAIVALLIAYVIGALVGITLLALRRIGRRTPVPMGTFLSAATVGMLLAGDKIVGWYLELFM